MDFYSLNTIPWIIKDLDLSKPQKQFNVWKRFVCYHDKIIKKVSFVHFGIVQKMVTLRRLNIANL